MEYSSATKVQEVTMVPFGKKSGPCQGTPKFLAQLIHAFAVQYVLPLIVQSRT